MFKLITQQDASQDRSRGNGIGVFHIASCVVDASNASQIKRDLKQRIIQHPKMIVDLEKVEFMDSSGLGMLLTCLRKATALGGDLRLCNLQRPVRSLLELIRMHRVLGIYNTKDEAWNSFE